MRSWLKLLGAVALGAISATSSASPQSDAFAQGGAVGNNAVQSMFSGINPTAAQTNIPGYGGSVSTQSGYYAGGNGNIEAPGAAQITDCSNAVPGSDPMANQYCNAVNFLATNPNVRPQFSLSPNDPLLVKSRAISNDPSTILQANGMSANGTTSQCVPVTTTTPAQYTTKMCNTVQGMSLAQCVMGRVVNITDNTNYQCNQTVNAYQTQTCNRTAVVTIPAMIPATPGLACPGGYSLSGSTCTGTPTAANPSYTCNSGTLSGTVCQAAPTQGSTTPATVNYSCPANYILYQNICQAGPVPGNVIPASPNTFYIPFNNFVEIAPPQPIWIMFWQGGCEYQGGSLSITGSGPWYVQCLKAITSYSCPTGYTLSGTTCYPPMVTPPPISATATYSCPSGSTLSGTVCQGAPTPGSTTPATVNYSCPSGSTQSGTSCIPTTSTTVTYTCGAGMTLSGSSCQPGPMISWNDGCSALESLAQ